MGFSEGQFGSCCGHNGDDAGVDASFPVADLLCNKSFLNLIVSMVPVRKFAIRVSTKASKLFPSP